MTAVLCVGPRSEYLTLDCDTYDEARDCRTFALDQPVVAHPPCRLFCRLRGLAKAPASERDIALWCVWAVRHCGGVLEHPAHSKLWQWLDLPRPGGRTTPPRDAFGGWTVEVAQRWWGHAADKSTWLYVVGVEPKDMPQSPSISPAVSVCGWSRSTRDGVLRGMNKHERSHTPRLFAQALLDLAARATV